MNAKLESMMIEATKDMPHGYYVPPQYFEKFAELVVKECIEQIHVANVGDLKGKGYYLDKVAEHIERYFEVNK